jgi:biopolymer transport protein ExbD
MKTLTILLLATLPACVSITKHREAELENAKCRKQLALSKYHHIEAPKAASGMETETTALAAVTADQVHINGEALSGDAIEKKLVDIRDEDPDTRLLLHAEPDVPYGNVIALMDQARKAGFSEYHLGVGPPSPILSGEE